jgi:hypothetical protein
MPKPKAHFLHIGKTGGTAVKHALEPHLEDGRYSILLHNHDIQLNQIPDGQKFFFTFRDPITRFVSAFYSRLRQGQPRYNIPWREEERQAFGNFKTANELAESLTDADFSRQQSARSAMRNIQHVRESVWHWLIDPNYFSSRRDDVLFVGFQETLDADFQRLKFILQLGDYVRLPTDPMEKHQNPSDIDRFLSERAKRNLSEHFATDIKFYSELRRIFPTI